MKKYYWSIEEQRVISIEELDKIRSEYDPEYTLSEYITSCSYLQNGDLEPLENQIRRDIRQVEMLKSEARCIRSYLYDDMCKPVPDYADDEKILYDIADEIEKLKNQISELKELSTERI